MLPQQDSAVGRVEDVSAEVPVGGQPKLTPTSTVETRTSTITLVHQDVPG